MKKLVACLVSLVAIVSAYAQTDSEKENVLNEFRLKVHKIELYNMILPVVMTKPQIRAILTVIEKCRERSRKFMDKEYELVEKMQADVDDALNKADKDQVPSPAIVDKLLQANALNDSFNQDITQQNIDDIYAVVTAQLNAGQQKAMANSLNPKEFPDWLKNPDQVSQEDKEKIFIRAVFMDFEAYDLLKKLSM